MRLTYLTLEAPREGQASYVHVHEIIAGLTRRGWDVELYQPPYTKKARSPGLPARFFHALFLQARLWLRWRRGSILYIRGHYMAYPSALIARLLRVPIVHEINGPYEEVFITYPSLAPLQKLVSRMQRQQFRWASRLIAVTPELCEWAGVQAGGDPAALISNGANIDLFHPAYERPDGLPGRYVVFFGGLAAWHGVPAMLAAAQSAQWPSGVGLVVIGDGAEGAAVRAASSRYGHIHALGRKAYKDVPAYVAHALAGLVPISSPNDRSRTGLFPLKLFETLACGRPAIVTDFPGQADFIREHVCGLVIPPDDPAALAQAVARLAGDPLMADDMGARGRAVIVTEHSWDARAQATHDLLIGLE